MRKIRLVAMDVDGTLIGKDKILTKRTKEALRPQQRGESIWWWPVDGRCRPCRKSLFRFRGWNMSLRLMAAVYSGFRTENAFMAGIWRRSRSGEFWTFIHVLIARWRHSFAAFPIHHKIIWPSGTFWCKSCVGGICPDNAPSCAGYVHLCRRPWEWNRGY